MKKVLALVLALGMALSLVAVSPSVVVANESDLRITFNGEPIVFNNPVLVRHGFSFFQVDEIFNALADTTSWDGETRIVQGVRGGNTVEVQINDLIYIVNGSVLDTQSELAPFVEDDLIYVYIDFVVEGLGLSTLWDGETRTLHISDEPIEAPPERILVFEGAGPWSADLEVGANETSITLGVWLLNDEVFELLRQMPNLRELTINGGAGGIPLQVLIDGLQSLRHLRELNIYRGNVFALELLAELTNLERISLDEVMQACMSLGDPVDQNGLGWNWTFAREEGLLSRVDITPLATLPNLVALEVICRTGNIGGLENIEQLSDFTHLQTLIISVPSDVVDGRRVPVLPIDLSLLAAFPYLTTFEIRNLWVIEEYGAEIDWSPVAHVENVPGRP